MQIFKQIMHGMNKMYKDEVFPSYTLLGIDKKKKIVQSFEKLHQKEYPKIGKIDDKLLRKLRRCQIEKFS